MLKVNKADIENLNDSELRELIGLLCESELNSQMHSSVAVTYGGNQDASDGGVDVRVSLKSGTLEGGYIPRNKTLFQVKVPSMSAASIEKEMKPEGILRESIKEVICNKGAYIIVSSKSDCTDSMLENRLSKMKECVHEVGEKHDGYVDFYDCNRIVSWTNTYPSAIFWVKNKKGVSTSGWSTFSEWRDINNELQNEFIFDEKSFIYKENYSVENRIPVIDGIDEIRNILKEKAKSVRIAGMSGVGKTRLAYALFDNKIGVDALDQYLVLYCDMGNQPNPTPIELIRWLISSKTRAIVIVDNCLKEQHSKLAKLVNSTNSSLSLLTIEYDAKEDDVIETDNYYMASSENTIIERYLKNCFPEIHHANIGKIVETSGGNFRMARYFAVSVEKNKPIGILNSSELFDRLFMEENKINENLLQTAEVCSLLFSFNITDELKLLSELTDLSFTQLRRNVAKLEDMQLIQSRGEMRALLPHGLANKLASNFLKTIPVERLVDVLTGKHRVLLSFSRRLKLLYEDENSQKAAGELLDNTDLFSDFSNISNQNMNILSNLSFIISEKILRRIENNEETFFSLENKNRKEFVNILIDIAYKQDLFDRVIGLLFDFALLEKDTHSSSTRNSIKNLFQLLLSGTHATIEQRLKSIELLLYKGTDDATHFAFQLIDELLKTGDFIGYHMDLTYTRPDYGYEPKLYDEYHDWYEKVIGYLFEKYELNLNIDEIKIVVAKNFRPLLKRGMIDSLEKFINDVMKEDTWPEMWVSIKNTKHFDGEGIPSKILNRLDELEEKTKPRNIKEEFKIYVQDERMTYIDIEHHEDSLSIEKKVFDLGLKFGENFEILKSNIDIFRGKLNYRVVEFGKGLVSSKVDFFRILNLLIQEMTEKRIINCDDLLKGMFLGISSDKNKISKALEIILQHSTLKRIYPYLQASYQLKRTDIERVVKSLKDPDIPMTQYSHLKHKLDELSIGDIIYYFNNIPKSNEGIEIIIGTIFWLFYNKRFDSRLNLIASKIILRYEFKNNFNNSGSEYEFGKVSEIVFTDGGLEEEVRHFFREFKNKIENEYISFDEVESVFKHIIHSYPNEFLDVFFFEKLSNSPFMLKHFLKSFNVLGNDCLDCIDPEILFDWANENERFEDITICLKPMEIEQETGNYSWTEFSEKVIDVARERENTELLETLSKSIYSQSYENTTSQHINKMKALLIEVANKGEEFLQKFVNNTIDILNKREKENRQWEKEITERYNTFE